MKGVWDRELMADLQSIRDGDASALVTLMETHELKQLRVPDIGSRVQSMGKLGTTCRSAMNQFWT